jgi:serine/threonine protein kinase
MQLDNMVGQLLDHYRVLRKLGQGGAATVFLAEDTHLHREVAVKVFSPRENEYTEDFLRRFEREARVVAQLDHPHILPVYAYGKQNQYAYLIMPYMAGGSLRDRLQRETALSIADTLHLTIHLLEALQYAHRRGLIHRDIKPDNILFKTDGTVLLSDFGMVKILPREDSKLDEFGTWATAAHTIGGTPEYMAPEQIQGEAQSASDIYSLGIVLYEMLTGQRPFDATNRLQMLMRHLNEPPPPPGKLNPQIPPELEFVVLRTLEKRAERRYSGPGELLQVLQNILDVHEASTDDDDDLFQYSPLSTFRPAVDPPGERREKKHVDQYATLPPEQAKTIHDPASHPPRQMENVGRPTRILETVAPQKTERSSSGTESHPPQIITKQHPRPQKLLLLITAILILAVLLGSLFYGIQLLLSGNTGSKSPSEPSLTVDCPSPGHARAATMKSIQTNEQQNLVYLENTTGANGQPASATLKSYSASASPSANTFSIASIQNASIGEAQISQDGQWTLFTLNHDGRSEMRLVRNDGQQQQTVYCTSGLKIEHVQWSFTQTLVLFTAGNNGIRPTTYLLDLHQGEISAILTPSGANNFLPRFWISNTEVYLTAVSAEDNQTPTGLYLLNVSKKKMQQESDLIKVVSDINFCDNFDTSYDSRQLYISHCSGNNVHGAPSSIVSRPAGGNGEDQTIFSTTDLAITTIRTIDEKHILLMAQDDDENQDHNGLWLINSDGTGLRRLTTDGENGQALCPFTQNIWSNISRDGNSFAVQYRSLDGNTQRIYQGSLTSGPFQRIAETTSSTTTLSLVGWTEM